MNDREFQAPPTSPSPQGGNSLKKVLALDAHHWAEGVDLVGAELALRSA